MATHTLDITKEHCPMTFVKTKLKLAQIAAGDTLEVLLTEGEPLENVPVRPRNRAITSSPWNTWRVMFTK